MMFARFARCIVTLALCCSIGGHWLVLQSMAWATMFVDYSQRCSFKQAIVQTFDGAHPCDLCKQISKAKSSEKNQESARVATKADLICVTGKVALLPRLISFDYPRLVDQSSTTFHRPPSPP